MRGRNRRSILEDPAKYSQLSPGIPSQSSYPILLVEGIPLYPRHTMMFVLYYIQLTNHRIVDTV